MAIFFLICSFGNIHGGRGFHNLKPAARHGGSICLSASGSRSNMAAKAGLPGEAGVYLLAGVGESKEPRKLGGQLRQVGTGAFGR